MTIVYTEKDKTVSNIERRLDLSRLRTEITAAMASNQVPGMALGIFHRGEEFLEGFGVTSQENPLPVRPDTLFQAASLTKLFTATLIMQLVEAGKIELDVPVRKYLPELRLGEEEVAAKVTLRHLLTHTAGWVGDYNPAPTINSNEIEDTLALYLEKLADVPQVTPLGEVWTYCNSGYSLLGLVIEKVTGLRFESALRRYLLEPLGMERSCFTAEEAITYRFAVGHDPYPAGLKVQHNWSMPRWISPAGGLFSNCIEMLRFARLHLDLGTIPDGPRLLGSQKVQEMQTAQIKAGGLVEKMALGWWSRTLQGYQILGHCGMGYGQVSLLEIVPSLDLALVIFTNSYGGTSLIPQLTQYIYRQLAGLNPPVQTPLNLSPEELAGYCGVYQYPGEEVELIPREGALQFLSRAGERSTDLPLMQLAFVKEEPDKAIFTFHPYFKGFAVEFLRDKGGSIEYFRFMNKTYKPAGRQSDPAKK